MHNMSFVSMRTLSAFQLSPPQRLPLDIPIKISNNLRNRKRAGDDGKREKAGKASLLSSPFPSFPARSLFLSPQPPNNTKGTLRSDDGDGYGNATKAKGLISKTTILQVHHAFLCISLPSLHDYDVKILNFTMYKGSTQATRRFPL